MSTVMKAVLVEGGALPRDSSTVRIALYNADGTPLKIGDNVQAEPQEDSEADTIEELVADYNALLTKLREAGLLAS